MVKLFGITGHVASGKTAFVKMLRRKGLAIVDVDGMLYDIFKPGTRVHKQVLDTLGCDVIRLDGAIDTTKLSILMCNEKWVADMVGSFIEDEIDDIVCRIKNAYNTTRVTIGGIESNSIFGTRLQRHLMKIIVVTCSDDIRLNRLMDRSNIPYQTAKRIIDTNRKNIDLSKADFVVDNSGSLDELKVLTEKVYSDLLKSFDSG
jgi:dephospho-CoA kinase